VTSPRAEVAARGLVPAAVSALIPLMADVGFEELGLVKALLRRFFSEGPWTAVDAATLTRTVGPGTDRVVRQELAPDLTLVAGWVDGEFFLDVEQVEGTGTAPVTPPPLDLSRTFDRGVVPEPTPNPRTIRFATGRRSLGAASASYLRGDPADERVATVFAADDDVVDVLVAADFVAVSLRRPARWPEALEPVLDAVADGFAGDDRPAPDADLPLDVRGATVASSSASSRPDRPATRLDLAWAELSALDPTDADDRRRLLAATIHADAAHRQVAAQLLDRAPLAEAAPAWAALLDDPSRAVRRAALDAVVGAEHESLRPLLERALADRDAWIRWKALHGLAVLGIEPSREAVARLDDDPDFRVRLEAANAAQRSPRSSA
jgi:hypothetical protein